MNKFRIILVITFICVTLSSCLGVPEISRAYPVKDYMIVDDKVIAVFTINEKEETYSFEEYLIYPCEGESIVAALFWEHLLDCLEDANEIYLYLHEDDYEIYKKEIVERRKEEIYREKLYK